jgi:tight adherence protein B
MIALALLLSSALAGMGAAWLAPLLAKAGGDVARWWVGDLLRQAEALGYPTRRQIVVGLWGWGGALALSAAWLWRDPVVAPSVAALSALLFYAPRWTMAYVLGKRRRLLRDQFVAACRSLANAARAGMSLHLGLDEVARETPQPLGAELERVVHALRLGRTVHDAVSDVQERLQLDTFDIFAAIVLVCHKKGGKLPEALDALARSLEENQRIERKLASETASGRASLVVICVSPLAFLGLYFLIDPFGNGLLFRSLVGQACLLVSGAMTYLSVRWALAILALEN